MKLVEVERLLDRAVEQGTLSPEQAARTKYNLKLTAREPDDPMPPDWPAQYVDRGIGPKALARRKLAYIEFMWDVQANRGRRLAQRLNRGLQAPDPAGSVPVPAGPQTDATTPGAADIGVPVGAAAE